jgi:hypothetical protein
MLRLLKCKLSIRGLLSALNAKDVGNGQPSWPCSWVHVQVVTSIHSFTSKMLMPRVELRIE